MDLETAQRHLSELRTKRMHCGEPMFGSFRYEEMCSDEAALQVYIESFSKPELKFDRAKYERRKQELLGEISRSHQERVRPT